MAKPELCINNKDTKNKHFDSNFPEKQGAKEDGLMAEIMKLRREKEELNEALEKLQKELAAL
jgi:hypothetical protein